MSKTWVKSLHKWLHVIQFPSRFTAWHALPHDQFSKIKENGKWSVCTGKCQGIPFMSRWLDRITPICVKYSQGGLCSDFSFSAHFDFLHSDETRFSVKYLNVIVTAKAPCEVKRSQWPKGDWHCLSKLQKEREAKFPLFYCHG